MHLIAGTLSVETTELKARLPSVGNLPMRTISVPRPTLYQGVFAGILLCFLSLSPCGVAQHEDQATVSEMPKAKHEAAVSFRNTKPGVRFIGSKACASCHSRVFSSFRQTSMGQSMVPGDTKSLAAILPTPATVYDKDSSEYFDVVRRDSGLFQSQYSLDSAGKQVSRQDWRLDYVIGAGANGFGFLVQRDHYLFEAPLSYYSTTHSWGFSPGFEIQNRGFTRPILGRCIGCHSGRPNPVEGQIGLYKDPPFDELAVGCENCHGPGDLHVTERSMDQISGATPPLGVDTSIVNPAHLSGWLADNICMRCHQGQDVRVEMPGKTLQDFRPGQPLQEYVSILKLSPEAGASPSALPLEHYFGMTLSKCYRAIGKLHCITCHDPHLESSAPEALANYRAQCLRCHTEKSCGLETSSRLATNPPDDCLSCHMPKRTVTTIAHAALTDHSIPAKAGSALQPPDQSHSGAKPELLVLSAQPGEWKRLESLPQAVLLQAYDSLIREGHQEFNASLTELLQKVPRTVSDPAILRVRARAEFRQNTPAATLRSIDHMTRLFRTAVPNIDDYLLLANLYTRNRQEGKAIEILQKARASSPYFREVYELLASDYMTLGQYGEALAVLQQGIELFPDDLQLRALENNAKSVTLGPIN